MSIAGIQQGARAHPEKTAVIHNGAPLSYAAFDCAISSARDFFAQFGLPVGATAIVLVVNLLDAWVQTLALRSLGLNTIHAHTLALAEDLALRDVACVVITHAERAAHRLAARSLAGVRVIVAPGSAVAHPRAAAAPDHQPLGGHILYTSGTTGTYKKLLQTGDVEDKRSQARADLHGLNANTVHQGFSFGLWTAAGFKYPLSIWHVGGCVVLEQRADALSRFFDHGVNRAMCVPSMLDPLMAARGEGASPDPALEIVVSSGFLSLKSAEAVVRRMTPRLKLTYGSSELAASALTVYFNGSDDVHWLIPVPGRTVRIVDEAGDDCAIGEQGELAILRTEIDADRYLDDEEASAGVFRGDYFYPGDMAVARPDGRVRVLGRTADVLNVQGQKIAVAPIEHEIQRRLGVDDVCLFGGLNADGEEELVIAVEAERAPDRAALAAVAGQFQQIGKVRFAIVRQFPRTEAGMRKVRRLELRRMVRGDA